MPQPLSPPRVLVAYASNHGQTRLVAERIAAVLDALGLDADMHDLEARAADPFGPDYAGVVVAASIHAGHHQKCAKHWAQAHAASLGSTPSAFVSVSLTAADDSDEARAQTTQLIDAFTDETGWHPLQTLACAGALRYREYDVATRVLMRLIARRHGQPTDVHRDVEFTDWDAVEQFARGFSATVTGQKDGSTLVC
ncbi:flavodoxin domain-containing protein [Conexibacter sp. JD483]|uniref:flavodoxin domain-containing protein n=1 Tax=unclassified Conexibacter TaxID=2627773 RepID=UPI00272374F9|nr:MULTISPECIES: flavodoxin domain-containing protein [unclassified Conexibacter]MDO8188527.1 flavodoxin domain-containing protein [Conexibacter sp. CPCC 205706]MDO8200129.1 flavodoxin domain-containing protein [Conexibacter sp. CPCC 205762]MDR9372871.1 flavodoxin domain-containing protein [Conexibacter sp. JD483]